MSYKKAPELRSAIIKLWAVTFVAYIYDETPPEAMAVTTELANIIGLNSVDRRFGLNHYSGKLFTTRRGNTALKALESSEGAKY